MYPFLNLKTPALIGEPLREERAEKEVAVRLRYSGLADRGAGLRGQVLAEASRNSSWLGYSDL